MSYHYLLRGWLEIPLESSQLVMLQIKKLQQETEGITRGYLEAWHPIRTEINTRTFLFYGAEVRYVGIDLLLSTIQSIIDLDIWNDDTMINGYFHADGEDCQSNYSIKVLDNRIILEDDDPLLI